MATKSKKKTTEEDRPPKPGARPRKMVYYFGKTKVDGNA